MSNSTNDDLFPSDLTQEEWLDALITPGSQVRKAWEQQSFNAHLQSVES